MVPLVDVSWILSLATPGLEQWTHEWSSHGGRDGDYALAQQHGLLLTKADLATASAGYLTYPHRVLSVALSLEIKQADYIRSLPTWRGK